MVDQCLKNPSGEHADEASSAGDALVVGNSLEPALAEAGAVDDCLRVGGEARVPEKGRVLLLDDDPAFRDIIRDCLVENGYMVVAVQNGGEGVREVLAGDFALVVCDISMPGLPGDMFYRAVERIRPDLCQRFIFVTGHGQDGGTNGFIEGINGFVLRKPFPLRKLLDAIILAEVRRTYQSVIEGKPVDGVPVPAPQPAVDAPAYGTSAHEEPALAHKVARIVARTQARPAPARPVADIPIPEPQPPARAGYWSFVFTALALVLVLTAGLWNRYYDARDRFETTAMERLETDADWTELSPRLDEAVAARSEMERIQGLAARLEAERAKPRWTAVLRSLVPPGDARIDIVGLAVIGGEEDLGACELRVRGVAGGTEPELVAQRFRLAVQDGLKKVANGRPVSARFEQLKQEPGALPAESRAAFVMIANVGSIKPAVASRKGGR